MKCPDCKGKGFVDILVQFGVDDLDIDHEFCETCQGTGEV